MSESRQVFVNRLAPNDILVVDGPAVIHCNLERGQIVLAVDAPSDTGVQKIPAADFREVKQKHGTDAAAIVRDLKHGQS